MKIYISGIDGLMSLDGLELVTPARKKQIEKYVRLEDKARSLAAGLLMRHVCGVTDDAQIFYGKDCKPYTKNMKFNISHSGDYVALAVAESEVGVDIEKIRGYSEKVAARCFTADELEWMGRRGTCESFFRLWTAKESLMKALGLGLKLAPKSFSALPLDSTPRQIGGKTWSLSSHLHDGHVISSAVECPCPAAKHIEAGAATEYLPERVDYLEISPAELLRTPNS